MIYKLIKALPILLFIGLLFVVHNSFFPATADSYNQQNPTKPYTGVYSSTITTSLTNNLYPTPAPISTIGSYAMIASSEECEDPEIGGLRFSGSSPGNTVNIYGGDIFSNACIVASNLEVNLLPYESYCVSGGCYREIGVGSLEPESIPAAEPLDISLLGIPEPQCEGLPIKGSHEGSGTIEPGQYTFIRVRPGDILTLRPGLYCLEHDFNVLGGVLYGDDVTIAMLDGDFISTGNSSIHLYAPSHVEKPEGGILNVLIYFEKASNISLQAAGGSRYFGTVYSPSQDSSAMLGGASEIETYNIQIIAGTIRIAPQSDFDIIFDPEHGYPK